MGTLLRRQVPAAGVAEEEEVFRFPWQKRVKFTEAEGRLYYADASGRLWRTSAASQDSNHIYLVNPELLKPGEPCPACGHSVAKSNAERQKAWRARKKDG